jgi:hypothetical protein
MSANHEAPKTKFLQVHIKERYHKGVKLISVMTRMSMPEVVENAIAHYMRMLETDKAFAQQLMEIQYPGSSSAPPAHRRKGGLTPVP